MADTEADYDHGGDDERCSVASNPSSIVWDRSSSWQGWYNNDRSWYWGRWPSNDWGSWWAHEDRGKAWQASDPAVASLLSRGHTVDRLTDEQLLEIVQRVDEAKRERNQTTDDEKPAAKKAKAGDHEVNEKEPSAKKAESKDAPEAKTNEEKDAPPGVQGKTREERRKRLHARYMRFARSLVSHVLN